MIKRCMPLLLALALSACGFHLRGMVDAPTWLTRVCVIDEAKNKPLAVLLEAQLDSYKIDVVPEPTQANYWLIINKSTYQQQIVSIGASTNPRQYQLILTVEFMLKTRQGQVIKPQRVVVVTRQLTVNNDRILGSNEEESVMMKEMRQDAVTQIINRLSRR